MAGKQIAAIINNPNIPNIAIDKVVANGVNIFLVIIGVLAVGMIIFAAIMMITSAGNPEKVKTARRSLVWGIVGLVIALSVAVIINLIVSIV
jgi:NADH:ubiquinone oxidoreductase subunit 6 (subunit J)